MSSGYSIRSGTLRRSFMPQRGQNPGFSDRTSGSIGQTQSPGSGALFGRDWNAAAKQGDSIKLRQARRLRQKVTSVCNLLTRPTVSNKPILGEAEPTYEATHN